MFTSLMRVEDDRSAASDFWFQPVGLRSSAGVVVTSDTAMRHGAVFASVQVLSQSMAVLPFELYRRRARGGRDFVTDHWLYRLFNRRPNRYQTPYSWRQMIQGHLAFRGNAYNRIVEGPGGSVAELLPLHPDRVQIELLDNGSWRYKHKEANGAEAVLRRDQVWHLKALSDDGILGLNPIEVCRESIGGAIAAERFSNRFFANDAKPTSGWIEFPGKFATDEARRNTRNQINAAQSGANRGKTMVLDQGMKWHEVGMTNADAQFIETRKLSVSDIARIFRIPPHKIGDLSRSTNNNIEQQNLEFWQDTMLPWTSNWASSIMCDLLGDAAEAEGLEVCFGYSALLNADSKTRGEYLGKMVLTGILTRNEAREVEGYNPLAGLDEPLVPQNERELSEKPETGATSPVPAEDDAEDGPAAETIAIGQGVTAGQVADAIRAASANLEARAAVPVIARASERALALASAAAERVLRKELAEVNKAQQAGGGEALVSAYTRHAEFVAEVMGVDQPAADAYCLGMLDVEPGDYKAVALARLTRLALTGSHELKG